MKNLPTDNIYVYVGKTACFYKDEPLYPPCRQSEIDACASEKKRREKYAVWTLLAYALQDAYGMDIRDCTFQKTKNGKWETDKFPFSLTHAGGIVAVALSTSSVGVDVEKVSEKIFRIEKKLVNDDAYYALDVAEKLHYLTACWTKKESTFKVQGVGFFQPETVADNLPTRTCEITVDGDDYALSVAAKSTENVRVTVLNGVEMKESDEDV